VSSITLRSLLCRRAVEDARSLDDFLFCRTASCELVYFKNEPAARFLKDDLTLTVFQKSTEPQRLVCYCFGHSAKEVGDNAVAGRTARIADEIAEKCRSGLDRCEEMNPQGSCCLGNVRAVAKAALSASGKSLEGLVTTKSQASCCCCTTSEKD